MPLGRVAGDGQLRDIRPKRGGARACLWHDAHSQVTAMTLVDQLSRPRTAHVAHTEEWFSILLSVLGTAVATIVLWQAPSYEPATGGVIWAVPVWCAFLYVLIQIVFLLVSATQIRVLGLIDSVLAVLPVIAGIVIAVEWALGHLPLSTFQIMTLLALLVAGGSEFLLTLWIRFVLNRRTVAIDPGGN